MFKFGVDSGHGNAMEITGGLTLGGKLKQNQINSKVMIMMMMLIVPLCCQFGAFLLYFADGTFCFTSLLLPVSGGYCHSPIKFAIFKNLIWLKCI